MKKQYFVLGHPITHTISPFINNRLFQLAGVDADYGICDISPNDLHNHVDDLNNAYGYNVTIPFKQTIIKYLKNVDEKAKLHGSVNTVLNNNGVSKGFTTDSNGFLNAIEHAEIPITGNIVILGCGGVARTIAFEMAGKQCLITIAVRASSLIKANKLLQDIKNYSPNTNIKICLIDELSGQIDLLINATPVGMFPNIDNMPVSENVILNCSNVFDTIYNPINTKLIKTAKANGSTISNGLFMLIYQAVYAHKIWNNSEYCNEDILQLYEDSKKEIKKIFY